MKQQETVSALLEAEHKWIDERFQQFQRDLAGGRVSPGPFREASEVLHRHIYLEEEVLFPEVETRGLVGPTTVMAQEHGEIWRFLSRIEELIQNKGTPGRIQDALKALRGLLEEHNFKEERILYPSADRLLAGENLVRVLGRLKEANPPEGWTCRNLLQGG